jgi:membrane protease YdiL (CAAX protease family)
VALGGDFKGFSALSASVPALFVVGLIAPLLEEPGWRGFALPRVLSNHSALTAAIYVGLLWGIWHIPLFWFPGISYSLLRAQVGWPTAIGSFVASVTALSILFTFVYLKTRGSLLIVVLFHDAVNTSADLLAAPYTRAGVLRPFFLTAILLVLTAIIVVGSGGLKGSEKARARI